MILDCACKRLLGTGIESLGSIHMNNSNSKSQNEISGAFFQDFKSPSEENFWAWEFVDKLVHDDPKAGLDIVLHLVNAAPSQEALSYVAAGPLEDLLKIHGLETFEAISHEAAANKKIRCALSHVRLPDAYPASLLLTQLKEKYRMNTKDPWTELTTNDFKQVD